jgi:hypothetical protein
MKRAALFVAAIAVMGACKSKAEINGIGLYHFGSHPTTRAAIYDGICQPTELTDGRKATWCFALPPIKVGNRAADVDAYFLGQETPENAKLPEKQRKPALEKMPLIEAQFKVRGCVEADTDQWLRSHLRLVPDKNQSKGALEVFQNHYLWVGALLPSEPGRCLIHMLPMSETAEIERIKAKAAGGGDAPAPPAPAPPAGSAAGSAASDTGSASTDTGSAK